MKLNLRPGDFVLAHFDSLLSKLITTDEELYPACDPYWDHSFFIINRFADTFDTVYPRVKIGNLYNDYKGVPLRIARWSGMDAVAFGNGYGLVSPHLGRRHPIWKLLAIAAGLARIMPINTPDVRSENEAIMLYGATCMTEFRDPNAWTPGHLAVVFKCWEGFSIIFEGIL